MIDIQQYRADYIWNNLTSNFSFPHVRFQFSHSFTPIVIPVVTVLSAVALIYVIRQIILPMIFSRKEKPVFLEITPPAFTDKTAYTTGQLFAIIHNIGSQRSLWERLLGKKVVFSFEIVSTREQGIRYVIKTTEEIKNTLQQNLVSYLPYAQIKEIPDYIPTNSKKASILEFKLKKHFAYPLTKHNMLEEHDPVAYITGMMTKLAPNEVIAFQLVLSPTQNNETDIISEKVLRNEDVLAYLEQIRFPLFLKPFSFIFSLIGKFFQGILWVINDFSLTKEDRYAMQNATYMNYQVMTKVRPARTLSSFEQELVSSIQQKVDQLLFETTIRAYIYVDNTQDRRQRIRGIRSSLDPFTVQKYQSLQLKYNWFPMIINTIRSFVFDHRLLSFFTNKSGSLLSVSEIADLYHFPYTNTTKTENIAKVYSKQLPAPLSLKKEKSNLDVIFAKNSYERAITNIGLSEDERRRHVYIIGATGTGKSTLMLSSIKSDIDNGKGICVIDPHGELAESTIACIPEKRKKDFVYINPDDLSQPIHINLLELTPGLSEEDSLREKEFIAESVVSLFRKIFSGAWAASAHRIEYILRNTIHTAFTLENPTLFTLFDLLNDEDFRKKALTHVTDDRLKKFWKNEFGKAGDMQRVKMNAGITSKIGRFLFSPSASRLLEHPKSTINFDDLLNSGKIVVCNVAKGKLGEDTSEVLGILILTKIQLAALKRAKIPQEERKDFYVYVDEFQTFATPSFVQMLSEARKYKVNLIMAEQSTSQQKDKNLVHIIIANVGTVICFRTANPEDEKLMLNYFSPYVNKGEIINLPSYSFYIKISAMHPEEPFSGTTILIDIKGDGKLIKDLIEFSRQTYGIPYEKKKEEKTKRVVKNNDSKDEEDEQKRVGEPDEEE